MPWPRKEEVAFTQRLERLAKREDGTARGTLAAMRRGLGKTPGEAGEALQAVFALLPRQIGDPPRDLREDEEDAYFLIASLAAWHSRHWTPQAGTRERTSLGASFAWLQREQGGESVERRFAALLNSHRDALPDNLRSAVGLLKAHDVPVDYARLLRDTQAWEWDGRPVQREWARDFWVRRRTEDDDTEQHLDAETELSVPAE